MKRMAIVVGCALLVAAGCKRDQGTVSGPGGKSMTLNYPKQVTVTPGSITKMDLTVTRTNFDEPVTVEITGLPSGVTVTDKDMTIAKGVSEGKFHLTAAEDAKPGNGVVIKVAAKAAGMEAGPYEVKLTVGEKKATPAQQRDELRAAVKPQIDSANKAIASLEDHAKTATGEAKIATEKQIAHLRTMRDSLQKELDRTNTVVGDAWDDFSRGLIRAGNDLHDATQKALEKLKK